MYNIQISKIIQKVIWYPYGYVYSEQIQKRSWVSPGKIKKLKKSHQKNQLENNSNEGGGGSADITSAAQEMPPQLFIINFYNFFWSI